MIRGEEKRRGSRVGREHGRIDRWILGIFERRIRPSPRRINYQTLGPTFNPTPLLPPVKLDRRHARIVRFRDPLAFVWLLVKKEEILRFFLLFFVGNVQHLCNSCFFFFHSVFSAELDQFYRIGSSWARNYLFDWLIQFNVVISGCCVEYDRFRNIARIMY